MQGLRGQKFEWSGVDGGWYSMVKDEDADIYVNVRVTAPLPDEFPNRQLATGLSIFSKAHSLVIEVKNPYDVKTVGCAHGVSPCLANGGLRAVVDGKEVGDILRPCRQETVVDDITVSASNLPVECRRFGGDTIWARMYEEMLQGRRTLKAEENFEDWIQRVDDMAAPDWCARYIAQHGLADVQSIHAIFKIETSAVTVRLNVGSNYQGNGDLDWDGRVLPDLEFWQMDVELDGLSLENESMSGLLGETARPVLDTNGDPVMKGPESFRGTVEDYRVSGPLGTDFALLSQTHGSFK